ncbi:MAG: hypothetical protein CSA49_03500 [Gammaproteobacteria bacterium]|nr:MAG: hypothetical protein CSA49_03500 [Gammaproteobacteria bacterium]
MVKQPDISDIDTLKQQLEHYLPHLAVQDNAFSFYELCGFLMAVCSSPQMIMPSEWLPIVVGEDLTIPEQLGDATAVMEAIMSLYNWVNERVLSGESPMPDDLEVNTDDVFANFGRQSPVGQWSKGFYEGYDWLSDIWESVVSSDDEWEAELSAYLLPLSFFVDENYARAVYEDFARQDASFSEVAEHMAFLLKPAAADYASLGRMIYETLDEMETQNLATVQYDEPEVGRNDPCPCGSGKKYKKCCLH